LPAPGDPILLAPPPAPAPRGWLRPGSAFGIPVIWMIGSLLALPLLVYAISYIPWALNGTGQRITSAAMPLIGNWPPGHTGDTLWDLTQSMYHYHDTLRATHAASSPWWAWPFDLKPVWFYQGSFAGNTAASIYDAGNLVIWWLGIPAMAFVAWQAFKRRSLALALLGVGFAWQWLAWSRIDRATFQYHYYTSVPFIVIGLAYFLAELWHGASARTCQDGIAPGRPSRWYRSCSWPPRRWPPSLRFSSWSVSTTRRPSSRAAASRPSRSPSSGCASLASWRRLWSAPATRAGSLPGRSSRRSPHSSCSTRTSRLCRCLRRSRTRTRACCPPTFTPSRSPP